MTQSTTQAGIQAINAEIIEPDSTLESNSSSKPAKFPCSKLEASKHLPISDVSIGKWLNTLADAGIRGQSNKVSSTDFHHLSEMCAYKERGDSPSDYVELLHPAQDSQPFRDTSDSNTLDLSTEKYETRANLALSRQVNGQSKALSLIESIKNGQELTRTRRTTGRETAKANAIQDAVEDAETYITTYTRAHNEIIDTFHGLDGGEHDCKS